MSMNLLRELATAACVDTSSSLAYAPHTSGAGAAAAAAAAATAAAASTNTAQTGSPSRTGSVISISSLVNESSVPVMPHDSRSTHAAAAAAVVPIRQESLEEENDDGDDMNDADQSANSVKSEQQRRRKISHSAIEKRRRQRINEHIARLQELVPACAGRENLQMVFVLRKAAEHMERLIAENESLRRTMTATNVAAAAAVASSSQQPVKREDVYHPMHLQYSPLTSIITTSSTTTTTTNPFPPVLFPQHLSWAHKPDVPAVKAPHAKPPTQEQQQFHFHLKSGPVKKETLF